MIRQSILLFSVGALTSIASHAIANSDPYLEQNGRLIVEIEAGAAEGDWSLQNSIHGHTGAGYLIWNGRNNYAKSEAPGGNPIQYHFRVSTPGNYELRWRSRNTIGNEASEHNDSWVRFPTGKNIDGQHFLDGWTKAYMGQVQQWTWDAYTVDNDNKPIRQYFGEGDHLIEIAGRSNGHGLDRFALYRYEAEQFSFNSYDSLAQSPKASQAALAARHTYAGNTCVGTTLSLTADIHDLPHDYSNIRIDNAEKPALLLFDIPPAQINGMSLKVSSTQPSLSLSAYLGSHSDWTNNTATQDLPYASTLLGAFQANDAQDQIAGLDLNNMALAAKPVTIILQPTAGITQRLHGISTGLEPRLEIEVSQEFCSNYQAARVSSDSQISGAQDQSSVDTDAGTDTSESNTETNTDIDTNTDSDTNTEENTSTETIETQSPFEIVDPRTDDSSDPVINKPVKKSGGALSGLTLFILAFASYVYRCRKNIIA